MRESVFFRASASFLGVMVMLGGAMTLAGPSQADEGDCPTQAQEYLRHSGDGARAHAVCRAGQAPRTFASCVDQLDRLDGIDRAGAEAACRKALP